MVQRRTVFTPDGPVTYTLEKKEIKNLNLRVRAGNVVHVSIPLSCPVSRADEMIRNKSSWITAALARQESRPEPVPLSEPDREETARRLKEALDRAYGLIRPLGVAYPVLKLRRMTSQWGNCHYMQGYITLNTALAACPAPLREYVALHELVHFLHHDHGPGFYGKMDLLMPDWQERRKALRAYEPGLRRKV